jgi:hypothetical protein
VAYAATHVDSGAASEELSALAAFLAVPERAAARVCACACGLEVRSPRARWFSEAHRKRGGRGRPTSRSQDQPTPPPHTE